MKFDILIAAALAVFDLSLGGYDVWLLAQLTR